MMLTVRVLRQDGIAREDWLGLTLLVDGGDFKLVEVAWFQALGSGAAAARLRKGNISNREILLHFIMQYYVRCSCAAADTPPTHSAGGDPLSSVDVHVSDQVVGDGSPAVVLGRLPTELDVLSPDLVRHEVPRFGGHVEHVDPSARLEGPGLAGQPDGVDTGVAGAVGLEKNANTVYWCKTIGDGFGESFWPIFAIRKRKLYLAWDLGHSPICKWPKVVLKCTK